MSSRPLTGLAFFSSSSINPRIVLSIPLFKDTGLAPEVTLSKPCLIISRARTEAVVVPSPAESFVLLATYNNHQHNQITFQNLLMMITKLVSY